MKLSKTKTLCFLIVGLFIGTIFFPVIMGNENLPRSLSTKLRGHEKNDEYIYYTYGKLLVLLKELSNKYPDIFMYSSLGKTYEDRDIWLVKISDNVSIDENEPEILYMGGVHGNENPGYEVVIYSINAILENYSSPIVNQSFTNKIKNIVNSCELYFMPMVNPDGIESNSRKNKRPNDCLFGDSIFSGVDINRNAGYKWEVYDKNPLKYSLISLSVLGIRANVKYPFLDFKSRLNDGVYRGPSPFSENESKAYKRFIETHNLAILIDYHTSGEKIIYPYGWTTKPPKDEDLFMSISENISKINGYSMIQGAKWYFTFGSPKSWAYDKYGVLPFTLELGEIGNQAPKERDVVLKICKKHVSVNLYLAERSMILMDSS